VWAKALFEGLYGPKENATNIIQDIVDEIASSASCGGDILVQAELIFERVFNREVRELLDNLNARL
jgi:hypothetical protein